MSDLNVVDIPQKTRRPYSPWEDGSSRCPYCLEKLKNVQDGASPKGKPPLGPPSGPVPGLGPTKTCPLCRHDIPPTLLGVPPHALNRAQQWDYHLNDMAYLLKAEHLDVESYIFAMGEFYNPDWKVAKDRFMQMLVERDSVVRLREEFLEAEGELETLIVQYLRKGSGGESGLAGLLLSGDKWRQWARGLSAEGAGPRLVAEFQLDYVRHLPWGAFESMHRQAESIRYLKERLEQLD
jgi:hypothetical protein